MFCGFGGIFGNFGEFEGYIGHSSDFKHIFVKKIFFEVLGFFFFDHFIG